LKDLKSESPSKGTQISSKKQETRLSTKVMFEPLALLRLGFASLLLAQIPQACTPPAVLPRRNTNAAADPPPPSPG